MNSSLVEILNDFVALFYPRYCLACEEALVKGEDCICIRCVSEMPKTDYHLNPDNPFKKKLQGRIEVKYVMAFFKFVKEGRVQQLLHSLKYKNHPEIGVTLGRVYGGELVRAGFKHEFDLLLPVPLHKSRKASRGYNQSFEFARGLSEVLEIPARDDLIERLVKTQTQTSKTRLNRWENVSAVFSVLKHEELTGKRVLLIDDVITTGATLEACASALTNCRELSIACIAAAQ